VARTATGTQEILDARAIFGPFAAPRGCRRLNCRLGDPKGRMYIAPPSP
jgi:hypothetical protein